MALAMGAGNAVDANPAAVKSARELALDAMEPGQGAQLEPHQQRMLGKAQAMLLAAGFDVSMFPLVLTDTLGPNVHGLARDGKIYVSRLPFEKGTRELAATLLEEFAHLRSGAADCTREFQNWFIDQMLVQAERNAKEPF